MVYFTSFTVCARDIKKSSENDQSTGHFQSFFLSPEPKYEKNSRKSTNKKNSGLKYKKNVSSIQRVKTGT